MPWWRAGLTNCSWRQVLAVQEIVEARDTIYSVLEAVDEEEDLIPCSDRLLEAKRLMEQLDMAFRALKLLRVLAPAR